MRRAAKEEGLASSVTAEAHPDPGLLRPHDTRSTKWNPLIIRSYFTFRRKRILTVEPVMFLYMFGVFLNLFVIGQYVFNIFGRDKYEKYGNLTGQIDFCLTTKQLDALRNGTGKEVEEEGQLRLRKAETGRRKLMKESKQG